jgi:hypothetical protein
VSHRNHSSASSSLLSLGVLATLYESAMADNSLWPRISVVYVSLITISKNPRHSRPNSSLFSHTSFGHLPNIQIHSSKLIIL